MDILQHTENVVTIDVLPVTQAPMTPAEARALTDAIKGTATRLHLLLVEAEDRQAWRALGYPSWLEYGKAEFGFGKSHLYRLRDHGRAVRELDAAAGSPVGEVVSEREARDIKPHLTLVADDVRQRIAQGDDPITAARSAITAVRVSKSRAALQQRLERIREMAEEGYSSRQIAPVMGVSEATCRATLRREGIDCPGDRAIGRTRRHDANRIMETVVMDAQGVIAGVNLVAFAELDRDRLSEWARDLRVVAREITNLAARLERHAHKKTEAT